MVVESPPAPPVKESARDRSGRGLARFLSRLRLGRLGLPLFWLILLAFIVVPCACFLLLCVSPRLFDQGPQWFTLTYLRQSLTGSAAVAVVNSLWVSSAAAVIGLLLGFPIAWLAARTTLPGRRWVGGGDRLRRGRGGARRVPGARASRLAADRRDRAGLGSCLMLVLTLL